MNTEYSHRTITDGNIKLNSSEFVDLERPPAGKIIKISVKTGVIRIGAAQTEIDNTCEVTLAFACRADYCEFNFPEDLDIRIEAITDATYLVERINQKDFKNQDSILDWIIQLHIVRHETNLENRLMKLFQLLTTRLGKRTSQGLVLDCILSHSRIAEMIGSTRSTVSRTISTLRKSKRIYIDELKSQIILPVD